MHNLFISECNGHLLGLDCRCTTTTLTHIYSHIFSWISSLICLSTSAFAFPMTNGNCIGLLTQAAPEPHKGREVVFFLLKCEMLDHLHISECQQQWGDGNGGFRGLCVLWYWLWMTIAPWHYLLLPLRECQPKVFTLKLHWSHFLRNTMENV